MKIYNVVSCGERGSSVCCNNFKTRKAAEKFWLEIMQDTFGCDTLPETREAAEAADMLWNYWNDEGEVVTISEDIVR